MSIELNEIEVNGVKYIPKAQAQNQQAPKVDGLEYVIVRTYSAGVFAGYLRKKTGQEVTLLKARRLWQWYGAASLSQLAMEGVSNPEKCKFPCEVDSVELMQAIEILRPTEKAKASIDGVPTWKA